MTADAAELGASAHLWWVDATASAVRERSADYLGLLPPEERLRWEGIRVERGREEYLIGRALLRTTLSRYVSREPGEWRFTIGERGKPQLDATDGGMEIAALGFNLAHAEGLVACVVSSGRAGGVDVEHPRRAVDHAALAARFFSPAEQELYAEASPPRRGEVFFSVWTLKEAYLKARGVGIGLPLKCLSFDPGSGGAIEARFGPEARDHASRWQFDLLRAPSGHLLATALERGDGPRIAVVSHAVVPLAGVLDGVPLEPLASSEGRAAEQ